MVFLYYSRPILTRRFFCGCFFVSPLKNALSRGLTVRGIETQIIFSCPHDFTRCRGLIVRGKNYFGQTVYCKDRFLDLDGRAVKTMTEIRYYPLIDCDTEGTEKVAMFPTLDRGTVMA